MLTYCWQEANDFPEFVGTVFINSGIELFKDIKLLLAFPEYKVPLLGGRRASQNDIFALARGNNQLVSIMVEGGKSEPFGKTIVEAKKLNAENALMLVHSFSPTNEWFDDYCRFLELFGAQGEVDSIVFVKNIDGIDLFLAWVKGK